MLTFIPESYRKAVLLAGASLLVILLVVGFGNKFPFYGDVKLAITGWMDARARSSLEKDIARLQTKIDSTNMAMVKYERRNDSLSVEVNSLNGRIYARIKSIDSIRAVVTALEKGRITQGNKGKVDDLKIANVNYFVDSLLHYRDSVLYRK